MLTRSPNPDAPRGEPSPAPFATHGAGSGISNRIALYALFAWIFFALLRNFWVSDDAFMYLRTALHFSEGNGLRFNINERVQSYSSALWMILVALGHLLTADSFLVLFLLDVFFGCALIVLFYQGLSPKGWLVFIPASILFTSRTFVDFQSSGLETPLLLFTLVGFARAVMLRKQLPTIAMWASMVVLTRFDAALYCMPLCAWLIFDHRAEIRHQIKNLVLAVSPLIMWLLFTTFYYGTSIPSPAISKLNHDIPLTTVVRQGVIYGIDTVSHDPVTAFTILSGVLIGLTSLGGKTRALALGALLHMMYVIFIGGDFMMGRFFLGELAIATSILAFGILPQLSAASCAIIALSCVLLSRIGDCPPFSQCDILPHSQIRLTGIADERRFWSRKHSLQVWTQDRALTPITISTWGAPGIAVKRNDFPGFAGYSSGHNVVLVDAHGLTDGFLSRLKARNRSSFRPGHLLRDVPLGYLESVKAGQPRMVDPHLNEFYKRYLQIVRGNLFSISRLVAVWQFSTGSFDHLLRAYEQNPVVVPVNTFEKVSPGSQDEPFNPVVIPERGVLVTFDKMHVARGVDLRLDFKAPILVSFALCDEPKGVVQLRSTFDGLIVPPGSKAGLQWHRVSRKEDAPFNCILVKSSDGDRFEARIAAVSWKMD